MEELRKVLRHEKKYLLTAAQALKLEIKLRSFLKEDPHNGETGYIVRSLYLDTPLKRDYQEKLAGVEKRRKMRLRIYDMADEYALLEMKQKQGDSQLKRSLKIVREHAEMFCRGDYTPLLTYEDDFSAECYGVFKMHTYLPEVMVEYRRKAFIVPENDIRITLDSQVRAVRTNQDIYAEQPGMVPVFHPGFTVLEVKYNHFLLSYVKDILNTSNKSETAVSKYAMACRPTRYF